MRYLFSLKSWLHARGKCGAKGWLGTTYCWPFGGHFEMYCGRPKGHTNGHGEFGAGGYR